MADSKNVWAAGRSSDDEAFFGGPLGTALPTDAVDVLDPALEPHGWMGDDGFVNNIQRDVTKHKDFAGTPIKTTQDNYEETVQVTCCESNPVVLKSVFGDDNVTVSYTSGHRKISIGHDDAPLPRKSWVVRVIDGVKTRMLVIPEGQVTEVGEVTWLSSELVQYTLTIDCFKPAAGSQPDNPKAVNEYIDEPDVTGAGTDYLVTLGSPSAGTFTLTYRGNTTAGIAYNAAAAAVKSALVALDDGYDASDWTVTGSTGGPYTITTPTRHAVTGSGAGLTGGTFSITTV